MDVLSGIGDIGFAVAYRSPNGAEFEDYPYHQSVLHRAEPVFHHVPGWGQDRSELRRGEELPASAQAALAFIEDVVGLPVALLSVGSERDQTIWTHTGRESRLAAAEFGR